MLRAASSSAPLVAGLSDHDLCACARRAARAARAVHQPRLFVLSGRRQASRRARHDPSLVALSVPIDYWDYLGWKDTLADPAHSARQRAYSRVRGDRQVYTPQIVVNGAMHVLGSDRAAIDRAIAQTDQKAVVMSLPVLLAVTAGNLTSSQGQDGEQAGGEVWLCPLAKAVSVAIGHGENHGHTITYHNVVRRWVKLGDWPGPMRPGMFRCRTSRPMGSMPPPSWCRKAPMTSRASSSARPTRRSSRRRRTADHRHQSAQ